MNTNAGSSKSCSGRYRFFSTSCFTDLSNNFFSIQFIADSLVCPHDLTFAEKNKMTYFVHIAEVVEEFAKYLTSAKILKSQSPGKILLYSVRI